LSQEQREAAAIAAQYTPQFFRTRLVDQLELRPADASILIEQGREVTEYFLAMVEHGAPVRRAVAWMLQDVLRYLNDRGVGMSEYPVPAAKLSELLQAIEAGQLDTTQGKSALAGLLENPTQSVAAAIASLGIVQVDASEMESLCQALLSENPDVIEKVKAGNTKAIAALVGQAKKKNRNADPRVIQDICLKMIASM
jgi:aspartyl-tRNA(Asn)/glutamyl-tRNA(Gln) amidotransferase subunit B